MKNLKSILIFSITFLGVVVFFELLLSLCGILQPIVRIDRERGERYRPNITCSSIFVSEGFGLARTNSDGWFGNEFKDMGENDKSVAVIGNSYVASRQVFYRNNYMALSEKKTNEILSYKNIQKNVSLFNFGKEDLPLNELLYVKENIARNYHPDHFLILINEGTFNVVTNRYVAHYEYENNKFKLDTSFKEAPFVKIYHSFELLTKSSVVFLLHRVQSHLPEIWEIFFDKFYIPSIDKNNEEKHPESIKLTEADKAFVKELSKDKRVIFMLNLNPALTQEVKSLIGSSSFINIEPPLMEMKKRGIDPNYWEIPDKVGHFNLIGHKIISEEITKKMLSLVLEDQKMLND
ncbi:MAG TPA: hypothetical protein VFM99_05575 [Chitinophagales bacterium]|nr:hypothetical protein [Chitinophagales bacterium]